MTHCLLSQLSPNKQNQIIIVRIPRIWDSINPKTDHFMSVDCVAVDAKNNAMHIMIREAETKKFKPMLKEGSVYEISRFLISRLKPSHNSVPGHNIITFVRGTKVNEIVEDTAAYPQHFFSFQCYNEIDPRAKEDKYMTDIIGVLRTIGPVQSVKMQSKDHFVHKRDLIIQELSGKTLRVTIWEELLRQINESELATADTPIIIVAGTTVKNYQAQSYISSCSATKIYIDLDIEETRQYKTKFAQEQMAVEIFYSPNPANHENIAAQEIRRVSIADLINFKPSDIKDARFSCKAVIMDVDPAVGWFYHSCNQCSKTLRPSDGTFWCIDHGQKTPQLIIRLNMVIADDTDQMELVAFGKPAENLINSTISKIAAKENLDRFKLPKPVKKLLDNERILEVGLTKKSIVNDILEYKLFDSTEVTEEITTTPLSIQNKQGVESSSNALMIQELESIKPIQEQTPTTDASNQMTDHGKKEDPSSPSENLPPHDLFPDESPAKKQKIRGKKKVEQ